MATTFQIKRSSVPGKVPNTTTLSIGELGLNLTDQVLYSSNGTGVFEVGANVVTQTVNTALTVGNSSINTSANSTAVSTGTGNFSTGANVGANVNLTTTGISIGNSTVNLSTNSTTIDISTSTNKIYANTTGMLINVSSTNAAMLIVQRGTGDSFRVDDINGDTTPFLIDGDGKAIQGHTASVNTGFPYNNQIHGRSVASAGQSIAGWNGFTPTVQTVISENLEIANGAAPTIVANGTPLAYPSRHRVHTDLDTYTESFRVTLYVDGTGNTTTTPTGYRIATQNATSATLATRLQLSANGNLGIGSTTPTEKLHVTGGGFFSVSANVGSNVTVNTSALFIGNATVNSITNSSSRPWTLIGKTTVSSPVASISQSVTFTDWSYVVAVFNSLSADNAGGSTVWISLANSSANIVTATANLAAVDTRSTSGRAEILSRARGHFIELQGVTEPSTDVANTLGYSGSIQPITAVSVSAQTATRILCGFTAGNVDAGSISFYGIRD